MEQNNFEKQVQQKMEQLQIAPSDAAWNNVEKRIAQKKERGKWIFILPVFILLLLLSAYFLSYNSKESNIPGNQNENRRIAKKEIEKNNSPKINVSDLEEKTSNSPKTKTTIAEVKRDNQATFKPTQSKNDHQKIDKSNLKTGFPVAHLSEDSDKNEIENDNKIKNNKKSLLARKSDSVDHSIEENIALTTFENKISNEDIEEKTALINQDLKDSAAVSDLSKIATMKKERSRWKIGFTFSAGTSSAGYEVLSQNKSALDYASPVTGSGGLPNNGYVPSNLSGSLAASAGAFIEKNILGKNKISIGLSYRYSSTKNKVGNKIDSAQVLYFSSSQLKNYHNQFHFLQVPVNFKLRLNPKRSLPLYWNAGIAISQLISSNALQFRSDRGLYYGDNSVFNKTQIGISTGFSATLFSEKTLPVDIGPYFYYGATKIADKRLYNKTHFSSIGISAEILLNKK